MWERRGRGGGEKGAEENVEWEKWRGKEEERGEEGRGRGGKEERLRWGVGLPTQFFLSGVCS